MYTDQLGVPIWLRRYLRVQSQTVDEVEDGIVPVDISDDDEGEEEDVEVEAVGSKRRKLTSAVYFVHSFDSSCIKYDTLLVFQLNVYLYNSYHLLPVFV